MKKLNLDATKVVIDFLVIMQGLSETDIRLPLHNTLRLRKGENVHTGDGIGFLFSVGSLLDEKTGKYEYCMRFILVDRRAISGNRLDVLVFPASTLDERNGVEEHAVQLREGKVEAVLLNYQRAMAKHAYQWLSELKTAGYLSKIAKKR